MSESSDRAAARLDGLHNPAWREPLAQLERSTRNVDPNSDVRLSGGPFDGQAVAKPGYRWTPISITNDQGLVPEGHVARYVPTRDPGVWRFDGYSKVIATIEVPEEIHG